jgi:hypothetical protein
MFDMSAPQMSYKFSNASETFDSVKKLLQSLPLLKFDREIRHKHIEEEVGSNAL